MRAASADVAPAAKARKQEVSRLGLWLEAVRGRLERLPPGRLAWLLFGVLCAMSLPLYNRLYSTGLVDIGEYVNNPVRLLRGELPYRDFWLFHPPGEVFLPFLAYRLFGLHVEYVLVENVLLNVLISVVSFVVARRLVQENALAMLTALLVFFDGVPTQGSMMVSLHLGYYLLFTLWAVLGLIRFLETRRWLPLVLSGFAMGCSFAMRLYDTAPAFLAFLLALVLHRSPGAARASWAERGRRILLFLAGLAGAWGALICTWLPVWDPGVGKRMLWELVVGSIREYTQTFYGARPWTFPVDQALYVLERWRALMASGTLVNLLKLGFRLHALINCLALYVLPFVAMGLAVAALRRRVVSGWRRTIVVTVLCWGLLSLGKVWKSTVIYYWMAGTTPLLFVWALLLRDMRKEGSGRVRAVAYGLTAVLSSTILVGVGLIPFRLATIRAPIVSGHGTILVEDASFAKDVKRLVTLIEERTREGDYIFIEPFHIPPLYAMTNRRNPTFYDSMQVPYTRHHVGLPTEEVETVICQQIASHETRLVVTEDVTIRAYPVLRGCIETRFALLERAGPYAVYVERREAETETADRRPET